MTGVSPLPNEEPLMIVEAGVNVMREIVGEDCGYGGDSVVGERKTPLRCGRGGSVVKGSSSAQDRDVSCGRGVGCRR